MVCQTIEKEVTKGEQRCDTADNIEKKNVKYSLNFFKIT